MIGCSVTTRLTNKQKKDILIEIGRGIEYMHTCGFIHRDIKINNILLKNGHALIADFGLARELGRNQLLMTVVGTPVTSDLLSLLTVELLLRF